MARSRSDRKLDSDANAAALFDTDRPGGLHERIYRSLLHAIVSGRFPEGSRLPSESELAATYAVSRPVVRQALEKIREEGLIESLRGSGNYVSGLDQLVAARSDLRHNPGQAGRSMLDLLEFRIILEPQAAYLAAQRRSDADLERMQQALSQFENAHANGLITHHFDFLFHEAIALATTNSQIIHASHTIEYAHDDERLLLRHIVHFQPGPRGAEVLAEHGQIFRFIAAGNPDGARDAMAAHIGKSRQRLEDYLNNADTGASG
jgi:DNA-binding FadR family transcriptional regulator